MGIRHAKPYTLRGGPSTKLERSEGPLVTTTVFAATTPENTPFAYHASTSINPNPTISPTFVEANYEILKSLLRERRRKIRNEDLRTKLKYFSEDYDEEREMEPRPEPRREATPTLRLNSPVGGHQPSTNMGETSLLTIGNPPAGGTFTYHPQGGYIPQAYTNNNVPSYNRPMHPTVTPSSSYLFYTQPMYAPPNMHVYPKPAGSFTDSAGFVTPFVCWIEDYPLPDGLKMPSHIGSYDGKGDLDNLLHLFEGAIHMQIWLMPTLKDFARIWWNSQKAGSILNYEDLKAKF
ncbi:hypothetical protein Tco_0961566 [Tanacetum coccineum]